MTFIMGFKQQKYLEKRKWQIINFENDVNCGIIAFCDKRSFLTSNALLLQRKMQREVEEIKNKMRVNLGLQRMKQKEDLMALKVSFLTRSSNLHHFTVIHRGDDIMSLVCCPILTSLYRMSCILISIIGIIFHLNYKKLCYAAARVRD
jgi:hypothetical protein